MLYFATAYNSQNKENIKAIILSLDPNAYINDLKEQMYIRSHTINSLLYGKGGILMIYLRDELQKPINIHSINLEDIEVIYSL